MVETSLKDHFSVTNVTLESVHEQNYSLAVQLVGNWQHLKTTLALDKCLLVDINDSYYYTVASPDMYCIRDEKDCIHLGQDFL